MLVIRNSQMTAFEEDLSRRIALSALERVRDSSPHAVKGLSKEEIETRLDTAINKTRFHRLDNPEDVEAFVRLCFLVGPNFDEYPPFKEIFLAKTSRAGYRLLDLFCTAEKDDWNKAAKFDILSRSAESLPVSSSGQPISSTSPEISDNQIYITPLQIKHAEEYFTEALHPDVWRLGRMKPLIELEDVRQYILDLNLNNAKGYAITGNTGQFLGAAIATPYSSTTYISYWVSRRHWGKEIATKALSAILKALREQGISGISLKIEEGNIPSIKVAEKCGFKSESNSQSGKLIFTL